MNKYQEALNYLRNSVVVTDHKQKERVNECTEVLKELIDKATFKKPIKRHYENEGESPCIKYTCPNGCHIQLHPVTEKNHSYEDRYCKKCGQAIDWSGEDE